MSPLPGPADLRPGRPWPLGVTLEGDGANIAVFSAPAHKLELCLFDAAGEAELRRIALVERTDGVFHGFLPGLKAGQIYGLRAHGPWAPEQGHRFNPARLLLDPYARAVTGRLRWEGPNLVDPRQPFARDPRDSALFVPKAVITAPLPPLPDGERPQVPWSETVIYEAHVKGLTRLHPAIPEAQRGTYAALGHPALIAHLQRLGVTTLELLPVPAFLDERHLHDQGLVNHWGYNPIAFMAPEPRYGSGEPLAELRAAIRALHQAGLEVVLDLVFNHTAEADHLGPTLSLRGLDNATYYRRHPTDPRLYADHAGTGNTLDLAQPRVLQLVMDSLRHWAALGVDGFRFDLATALGRDAHGRFTPQHAFFQAVAQDPLLGRLKLIAEPWDVGPDGYQAGRFPAPFAEWNDGFRDTARRFWRGDAGMLPALAGRLLASADRFEPGGRKPHCAINYVAAHDGFTTHDLVTYARKHNEANGENNRDGHGDEHGASYGHEGETPDPGIQALRRRQHRNLLASLLLAQGTPMLLMGDEMGRSQGGNNNAYCQDNPTSWYPWDRITADGEALTGFVAGLIGLRRAHPALRRRRFLHGRERGPSGLKDAAWIARDGLEKEIEDWHDPCNRCFGLLLDGAAAPDGGPDGRPQIDEVLLLLANAEPGPVAFTLPATGPKGTAWVTLIDTASDAPSLLPHAAGSRLLLAARSLRLLRALEA